MVVGRQPPLLQSFARRSIKDTYRQAVFFCQLDGQLENIYPATIRQAMPIQMGWRKPSRKHGFNLRPEFDFQLGELDLSQKCRDAFESIEKASFIDQGWHFVPAGERPAPIMGDIADDGQVNTTGNLRMVREQLHRMQSPRARNHQGRRTDHAILECAKGPLIARMRSPKIVSIDNQ